jgi:hypothetical protein
MWKKIGIILGNTKLEEDYEKQLLDNTYLVASHFGRHCPTTISHNFLQPLHHLR